MAVGNAPHLEEWTVTFPDPIAGRRGGRRVHVPPGRVYVMTGMREDGRVADDAWAQLDQEIAFHVSVYTGHAPEVFVELGGRGGLRRNDTLVGRFRWTRKRLT